MKELEKINILLTQSKNIKDAFGNYERYKKGESQCDKHGFGFNLDDRFAAHKGFLIRVDSWKGYYGNSNCSTFLRLDSEVFNNHLKKAIDKRFKELLFDAAESMRQEAVERKEKAEKELNEAMEKLRALN